MVDSRSEVTKLLHQWTDGRQDALIGCSLRFTMSCGGWRRATSGASGPITRFKRQRSSTRPFSSSSTSVPCGGRTARIFLESRRRRCGEFSWITRARDSAGKRGAGERRVSLDEALVVTDAPDVDVLALDEVLTRLAAIDPQQSRVVELRYFAGLTDGGAAEVMHISPATVGREWVRRKRGCTRSRRGDHRERGSLAARQRVVSRSARARC